MDVNIIDEFIQENLTLLDDAMDQIGTDGCDIKGINAIFRSLHTLKGSCGFLKLEALSHFTHKFEEFILKRQEKKQGLDPNEGQLVLDGLALAQEAVTQAEDVSIMQREDYANFLESLAGLDRDTVSLTLIAGLIQELQKSVSPEMERQFTRDLVGVSKTLQNLVSKVQTPKRDFDFAVSSKILKRVEVAGKDLTEESCRILSALEMIAERGKQAFKELDRNTLNVDLLTLGNAMGKKGFLLGWDIIEDFCEDSQEVIEEAFRRFWVDGITKEGEFELDEVLSEEPKKIADKEELADALEYDTKKTEAYLRVAETVLHRLSNSAGDLVADRNSIGNLIQEISSKMELQYKRNLEASYVNLDKHVNEINRELSLLTNRQLKDIFDRIPSMINTLSTELNKNIRLEVVGSEIEVPRDLIRALNDSIVHIVRNTIDHGIETPAERKQLKKPEQGVLQILAQRSHDQLNIRIQDDGKGLDTEAIRQKAIRQKLIGASDPLDDEAIHQLIFLPGFSTAQKTTSVSGRGVGMDVVKSSIAAKAGHIKVESSMGKGTALELILPLEDENATRDILLIQIGDQDYGVEYRLIKEILNNNQTHLHTFKHRSFFTYRDAIIPCVKLSEVFFQEGLVPSTEDHSEDQTEDKTENKNEGCVIVIEDEQKQLLACRVERVLNKIKAVIAPPTHDFLKNNIWVRGTAVLGMGKPYPILNFRDIHVFTESFDSLTKNESDDDIM